jgi:hypothetical protein
MLREKGPVKSGAKCEWQLDVMAGIVARAACGVKRKCYKMLW